MIDLAKELLDYHIINLKDISQNESDIPDNICNSVILFNKALESLRTGNEDIAIIELKKAISMNPQFYEAMNLLGICYSCANDTVKAADIFNRVIKAEQNSVKALDYLNQLNSGNEPVNVRPKTGKTLSDNKKRETFSKNGKQLSDHKKASVYNFTRILLGFIAGVILILVINLTTSSYYEKDGVIVGNTDVSESLKKIQAKYDDLSNKNTLLQKDMQEANQRTDYYKSVIKIYEIENLASSKKYESAADMLLLLKSVDFKDDDKVKFDDLYKSVMPVAAATVHNDGYNYYIEKQFPESLKKLEKVELYDPAFSRMDSVLYYMGRDFQELNDSRNAIAFFQELIDNYQSSNYIKYANVRIKALTQLP